jgi:hypothetical protein
MNIYNSGCLQMGCSAYHVLKCDFVFIVAFMFFFSFTLVTVFKAKVDMEAKAYGKHIVY